MAILDRVDELADYSEQVRDVLAKPPSGLVRRGTVMVILVVGLLIGASSLIRYPDTLVGPVVLTTNPQPQKIIIRANGRLGRLLARNNQLVSKEQPLAEVENTTQLVNVPRLQQLTAEVHAFLQKPAVLFSPIPEGTTFGDIQPDVNTLITACMNYHRLITDGFLSKRLNILSREINQYHQLVSVNERQAALNTTEVDNAEKKYRIDRRLYQEKVYSQVEFLGMENEFLRRKRENEEFRKTLLQNTLQIEAKEKERLDLQQQQTLQLRTTLDIIQQTLINIENLVQTWRQNYLITAPFSGQLHYLHPIEELQSLQAGDTLLAIVPQNKPIIGSAWLSAQNRGKLRIGQAVIIRLADYPFAEYGILRGKVSAIFQSSNSARCRIEIIMPDQLSSSYNKKLPYRYEMPGTVEVVTEDLSLLQRALFGLRKLLLPN
ncbi:HlyD family efflux transporter periplasmic adaptor subunit [Spirosoma utsteinense]|uniref:HlyD family secretion protein n=1 Tax=Spirosoma utsteinense TaxID=2585773 RepID=A0ABR6WBL7_9BACT|nr:HlyD family efflux transporter periplasmic adaptor subunit [Spirosoma utsteinense]MBC3788059.1 HlyD family secretion protein [Spirosoma utsteinense]MBC3793944.1 HlyD family secretion protein [Spirosoma utsteinense]